MSSSIVIYVLSGGNRDGGHLEREFPSDATGRRRARNYAARCRRVFGWASVEAVWA